MENHQIKWVDKRGEKWNGELNLAANPLMDGTQENK